MAENESNIYGFNEDFYLLLMQKRIIAQGVLDQEFRHRNYVNLIGTPTKAVQSFLGNPDSQVLADFSPDKQSYLYPKISLYKVENLGTVNQKEIPIPFHSYIRPDDIAKITKQRQGRAEGVSIQSLDYEFDGTDPALKSNVSLALKIRFQNVEDLVDPIERFTDEQGKKYELRYSDLINVPETGSPGKRLYTVPLTTPEQQVLRSAVKLVCGWEVPTNKRRFFDQREMTAIKNTQSVFYLSLKSHSMEINSDGTFELDLEYLSSMNSLFGHSSANFLRMSPLDGDAVSKLVKDRSSAITKLSRIEATTKQKLLEEKISLPAGASRDTSAAELIQHTLNTRQRLRDSTGGISELEKEIANLQLAADSNLATDSDVVLIEQINEYQEYIDALRSLDAILEDFDKGLEEVKATQGAVSDTIKEIRLLKMRAFSNKVASKLRGFRYTSEEWEKVKSYVTSIIDPESSVSPVGALEALRGNELGKPLAKFSTAEFSALGFRRSQQKKAMDEEARRQAFPDETAIAEKKRQLAEIDKKTSDSFGDLSEKLEAQLSLQSQIRRLEKEIELKEAGLYESGDGFLLTYYLFGDLIDAAFETLIQLNGSEYEEILSQFKLILTMVKIDDPILSTYLGEQEYYSMADIPISSKLWHAFWQERVVGPQREIYTLAEFVKEMYSDLLARAISQASKDYSQNGRYQLGERRFLIFSGPLNGSGHDRITGTRKFRGTVNIGDVESFPRDWNPETANCNTYIMLQTSDRVSADDLFGDPQQDQKKGIVHLAAGLDKGIVKSIKYEKEDDKDLQTIRIANNYADNNSTFPLLQNLYNTTVEMAGNTLFVPGMTFYIKPIMPGRGNIEERIRALKKLGLGGYYVVTKVINKVDISGFNTTVQGKYLYTPDTDKALRQTNITLQTAAETTTAAVSNLANEIKGLF